MEEHLFCLPARPGGGRALGQGRGARSRGGRASWQPGDLSPRVEERERGNGGGGARLACLATSGSNKRVFFQAGQRGEGSRPLGPAGRDGQLYFKAVGQRLASKTPHRHEQKQLPGPPLAGQLWTVGQDRRADS